MSDLKIRNSGEKKRLEARLKRIEGQLRGVQDMVEREELFKEIVQQLAASREAIHMALAETIAAGADELVNRKKTSIPIRHARWKTLIEIIAKYG